MKTLASGFALLLCAVPVSAQDTADPRWSRWTGCWELVTENAREGAPSPQTADRATRTQPRDPDRPQVCVESAPTGGATFTTKVGTQTPIIQTVIADGKDRPVTEDGCTGIQRAEWSSDGLRLFAHAELTCKEEQGVRQVSGLAMLGPNGRWTDVQSVNVAGRESFRVRQYRRAADNVAAASKITATALTLEDIKEASAKVSPRALEAALVETRASFNLTSKNLLDLQAAGVPSTVVDLMVALSYPDRFVIERTARVDRAYTPVIDDPLAPGWGFGSDFFGFYSPMWGPYYYSPYYYSPFAYRYGGFYPFYYGGGGYYPIDPGGGGGTISPRPTGQGRVVDGQGYTRVRPREPESAFPVNPGGGSTASSSGGGGGSSSSGSSGGGSVSTSGFSSGGGDGGRTAQPR
jgi:uncharacterized membrane protein YgcG